MIFEMILKQRNTSSLSSYVMYGEMILSMILVQTDVPNPSVGEE